jgi:hypothetical protein
MYYLRHLYRRQPPLILIHVIPARVGHTSGEYDPTFGSALGGKGSGWRQLPPASKKEIYPVQGLAWSRPWLVAVVGCPGW